MTKAGLDRLKEHEGLRLCMYLCSEGFHTIGWGFNLDARPIPLEVARLLLSYSVIEAENEATALVSNWTKLSLERRDVLIEMVFQLGADGVRKFKKFLSAIEREDFDTAAAEMLDSRWAQQTPKRAQTLAQAMREGTPRPNLG